jgi:hypothetical protein
MSRIALTDGSGRWFSDTTAEYFKEDTYHDGRNWISKATGSQTEHEGLYRTKGLVTKKTKPMSKNKKQILQAILLLIAAILLCFADSFSQDNRTKYYQYSDSMWMARKNKNCAKQNSYLDSMSNITGSMQEI